MKLNKKQGDYILIGAGILCLIVFVTTGFLLLNYWYESRQQEKINQQLAVLKHGIISGALYVPAEPVKPLDEMRTEGQHIQESIPVTEEGLLAEDAVQENGSAYEAEDTTKQSLREMNPDYVMWLQIMDTQIDYPVVQRDNSYYLRRDFYGQKNRHGTIFLDENCDKEGRFLLIHGHRMKDGTMFGSLKDYKKADFRDVHRSMTLDWETETEHYEFFAGALIDLLQTERFHYEDLPKAEEEIKVYLQQLENVAFWYEKPQIEADERFVVLSTCDYGTKEQRFILVAVEKK